MVLWGKAYTGGEKVASGIQKRFTYCPEIQPSSTNFKLVVPQYTWNLFSVKLKQKHHLQLWVFNQQLITQQ